MPLPECIAVMTRKYKVTFSPPERHMMRLTIGCAAMNAEMAIRAAKTSYALMKDEPKGMEAVYDQLKFRWEL